MDLVVSGERLKVAIDLVYLIYDEKEEEEEGNGKWAWGMKFI